MRGVVLCGGQSTRMGSDKGLLRQAEQSWAEIAAAKLSSLQMDVVISVNNEQFEDYSSIFPSDRLIVDDETISVKGPLLGLLTVHQDDPTDDLLVLACDMVNVNELILRRLVDAFNEGLYDAYVYKTKDVSQPLCAVYSSTGLKDVYWRYQHNGLKKFSMMYVLDSMNVRYLPVEDSFEDLFNNYNSPESC
ncbi:MAG: molybdenum cofactor guanylyltransferase [Flavisolibacter sp.]